MIWRTYEPQPGLLVSARSPVPCRCAAGAGQPMTTEAQTQRAVLEFLAAKRISKRKSDAFFRAFRLVELDSSGCWLFMGALDNRGYGQVFTRMKDGKKPTTARAHRVIYASLRGEIPSGMELDHLCKRRNCCNPDHLDVVTHAENVRRGNVGLRQRSQTHCKNGHPFNDINTRWRGKWRACIECNRVSSREYARKKRCVGSADPESGLRIS